MAAALEATGGYRVMRRMRPRDRFDAADGCPTRVGVFIDLETTGLDPERDEIIEMGLARFAYSPADGRIFDVGPSFAALNQSSEPIPEEITRLTGITDRMVEGRRIEPAEVAAFVEPASIVVAHNASFDRPFAERFCGAFAAKPWACSLTQVDWAAEGHEGRKLGQLLAACGLYHDGHRAMDDCLAGLEVLAAPLPVSRVPAFAKLLEAARRDTCRVWAEGSPFEAKDWLKSRGYRWSDGTGGQPKSWFRDVDETELEGELNLLRREVYGREVDLPVVRMSAYDRFSARR